MDRRSAILLACGAMLGACGGGGGGGSGASSAALPVGSPAPNPVLSSSVVAWGDSLTPGFALNLQVLYPDRTVVNDGIPGATSTTIANAETADADHRTWINVFWYGQNNEFDPETIKADIARSIAHLVPGNDHFIVMSVVNKGDGSESRGTPAYATIIALNTQLAQLYPANYIDIRAWLVAHYDPNNPQDVADFANDVVPSSLRYDYIHLRNEGSVLVAQRVKQFIDAKGW